MREIRVLLCNVPGPSGDIRSRLMPRYPPLGLAYLAAVLRRDGASVRIIDTEHESFEKAAKAAADMNPVLIGVSAVSPMLRPALRLAQIFRNAASNALLVIGGPITSALPERALGQRGFDAAVVGEGEHIIASLAQIAAEEGRNTKALCGLGGLILRNGEGVRRTPAVPPVQNLDGLPFPALDLLPAQSIYLYHPVLGRGARATALVTSRGCPFRCAFCYQYPYKNAYRVHSVARIIEEIDFVKRRFGVQSIRFLDDMFTFGRDRILELCEEINRRSIGVTWHCNSRVDLLDPELIRAMAQAGCRAVNLGLESDRDEDLHRLGKKSQVDPRHVIEMSNAAGIDVVGQFILGFPWDDRTSILRRIRFACSLPLCAATFWPLIPFPGTKIYQEALQRFGEFEVDFCCTTDVNDPGPCFYPVYSPPGMTRKELAMWVLVAQLSFHMRPKIMGTLLGRALWGRR